MTSSFVDVYTVSRYKNHLYAREMLKSHPKPVRRGCPTTPNTGDASEEANSINCNTVLT